MAKTKKKTVKPKEINYSFPTKSRCKRCGSLNTTAVRTHKNKQYRRCRSAVCRHKYAVIGDIV